MFDVIEKTRAHAFLDLLAAARIRRGAPVAFCDAVDNLLGRIAAGNEALRRATLGDDEKAAANRLLRDQQRYALQWADLQAQMADAQGQDEQLNPRRIGLAETQARLGPDQVMLLYQLGERASHLLAITAGAAHAFRLPSRRTIELATLPLLFDCSFGDDRAIAVSGKRRGSLPPPAWATGRRRRRERTAAGQARPRRGGRHPELPAVRNALPRPGGRRAAATDRDLCGPEKPVPAEPVRRELYAVGERMAGTERAAEKRAGVEHVGRLRHPL